MTDARSAAPRTRWSFAVLFGALGALLVGIVVLAFVWPAATAGPRDLPVGITGPATQVAALRAAAQKQDPDPFRFVVVGSRKDAVQRIRTRELSGAFVLGDAPEVLTSSAASSVSNQALRAVAAQLQQQIARGTEQALVQRLQGAGRTIAQLQRQLGALQQANRSGKAVPAPPAGSTASIPAAAPSSAPPVVRVTDVVALSDSDPTGGGLAAASFPLSLGGMLGGVLVSLLVAGTFRRILALLVYAVTAGAALAVVLQTWLRAVQGDWPVNAAAFGLALVATAALVVGCNAVLGPPGIGVGAVLTILVGNPISGAALPAQFIAGPWGEVGQYFVPGAASTLVRSLSYFPDADTAPQWWVLGAWAVGGLLLTVAGHFRAAAPIPLPSAELEHPQPRRSASAGGAPSATTGRRA